MKILQEIEVPDFDSTKWEYVPFVDGQVAEVGWKYCVAGSKDWTTTDFSYIMSPTFHYLRPIPQPEPIEPEDGYEMVPYDPKAIIQEDWLVWNDYFNHWQPTAAEGDPMDAFDDLQYCRPISKPSLPPVPEGYEVVEGPTAISEKDWKFCTMGGGWGPVLTAGWRVPGDEFEAGGRLARPMPTQSQKVIDYAQLCGYSVLANENGVLVLREGEK